uniref:Rhodopsin n=1 Tax=Hemiselmis andersenii TaxID=464988 RepID=A0A7S1GYM6_HEMAN|mmetsp:Transcript_25305/g.61409  ORF Transcript_25305/g.61409 Transcript_25305/m.61409 type:complete len:265 (+) Transcript_25305:33-827(+)
MSPVFQILNGTSAEAAADGGGGDITFPDDFPNSVKHFLLIGAVGMMVGAGIFLYLSMIRTKASLYHSLAFIMPAISAMSYYAMWTGMGVEFKTTDTSPRVIFWARYIDYVVTVPHLLIQLALIAKADTSAMVASTGNSVLFVIALLIGAMNVAPFKYMWWFGGVVFAVLIVVQLAGRYENATDIAKVLNTIGIVFIVVYPLIWLLGSEGTASLGLSQEVAFLTILDLVTKVGFGLYFLLNFEAATGDEVGPDGEPLNQQSQQYV